MPLLKQNQKLPEWSEVDYFEIINLNPGKYAEFISRSVKELIFVAEGKLGFKPNVNETSIKFSIHNEGSIIDSGRYRIVTLHAKTYVKLIRIGGFWKDDTGNRGFFTLLKSDKPMNEGDPVHYDNQRNTVFDNHYHDFDEYWIIFEGRGFAVSEGIFYEVGAGDCIATRVGNYHDFPIVLEPVKGIWFETTLKRKKRLGHLWIKNNT